MTVGELISILSKFEDHLPIEARNAVGDMDFILPEDIEESTDGGGARIVAIKV